MGLLDVGIIFPESTDGCEGGVSRVQMVVGCSAGQYPMTSMPPRLELELRPPSFTQSVEILLLLFQVFSKPPFIAANNVAKSFTTSNSADSKWEFPIWQEIWRLPAAALREKGPDGDHPQKCRCDVITALNAAAVEVRTLFSSHIAFNSTRKLASTNLTFISVLNKEKWSLTELGERPWRLALGIISNDEGLELTALIDVEIVSDTVGGGVYLASLARSASRIGSAPTAQGPWLGTGILEAAR
ncbi:hypothetical protein NEUTE2DRAFT_158596 [Neurospora tetrasperma FGSC 2509]|nr:hypothetical protein NEUTE2DRAFT_158596 [Neurospora tetrasperma FGSC 2509]